MATIKKRSRLSPLEIATMVGLALTALGWLVLDGKLIPTGMIFVVIPLVLAGLVLTRNRSIAVILIMTLFGSGQVVNFLHFALLNGTTTRTDNGS